MQISKASIRYARALYDLALEYGVEDNVYENMHMLMDILSADKSLPVLLSNPVVPVHVKQMAVRMIFEGHIANICVRFINLIIRRNRSADIFGIVREYVGLYRKKNAISRVVIRTPYLLKEEEKNLFRQWFAQNRPGQKIEIFNKVQPSLIGGFTMRVDWQYVDQSVAGRLQRMRREVNQRVYHKES